MQRFCVKVKYLNLEPKRLHVSMYGGQLSLFNTIVIFRISTVEVFKLPSFVLNKKDLNLGPKMLSWYFWA